MALFSAALHFNIPRRNQIQNPEDKARPRSNLSSALLPSRHEEEERDYDRINYRLWRPDNSIADTHGKKAPELGEWGIESSNLPRI